VTLNRLSFFRTVKKGKLTVFKCSLDDIKKTIQANNLKEHPLEEIVPTQYHELLQLLIKVIKDWLLLHRLGIDHQVLW